MPAQKATPEQQEAFDHLLAKATKMIFDPEITKKLVSAATESGNIVGGLKSTTEAIIDKLEDGARGAEKPIPKEMRPSLSLMVMAELAEVITEETGEEIPEEVIAEAMGYLSEEKFTEGLQNGSSTPERVASLANEYGGLARELNRGEQAMQQTQGPIPEQEVAQQNQGGLL